MRGETRSAAVAFAVAVGLWALPAAAQEFHPFDAVKSVCPSCPETGYDVVTLRNGQTLDADVVAENPDFYVLRKFGELRAVRKDLVAKIDRRSGASEAGYDDQIITTDGLVLAGKIVRERADTGMYDIQIPPSKEDFYVYKPLIQEIFEGGKKVFERKAPAVS